MKKLLLVFSVMLLSLTASAQFDSAPAFPGAEGFGRYTSGGRGGVVYHVTRLDDDNNPGSFRYACNQSKKRTIVFDVSGTIYLKSELQLKSGNVSILGQTAPGDGICIADYPFTIKCSNVILRYMRFRLGNQQMAYHEGDGLGGMDQKNIIVDHCSVSWSIDECLSVYGSTNISVQWCFVDQSLYKSGHSKGEHGYGGNWGGSGASYHHNLLAHHTSRTPRLGPRQSTQTDERMDMRNNVIYNWGGNGCYGGEGMNVNIVNNFYKPGPATATRSTTIQRRIAAPGIRTSEYTGHYTDKPNGWDVMWHVWGKFYVIGNVNSNYDDVSNDNWTYGVYNQIDASGNDGTYTQTTKDTIRLSAPIPFGHVTTHRAFKAFEKVIAYAGASHKRDSHDAYIAKDVENGTAKYTSSGNSPGFINSQADAGGWPVLNSVAAPADTDGDGMPDEWETAHGLNPNVNDANRYNLDSRRYYTNLEVYCNSLVENDIKAQNADALTSVEGAFEEYYPDMKNGEAGGETENRLYYHPGEKGNRITFEDGATLQITGNSSKTLDPASNITFGTESYKSIKLSNGAENTFTCPQGKYAVGVTFYSYINKEETATSRTSFWSLVDDQTFTADDATILRSYKDAENPDKVSFTVGGKPSFKFCNSGDQLCFLMDITYGNASGITAVEADTQTPQPTYNIMGQRVRDNAKGITIRNGKKYIVR